MPLPPVAAPVGTAPASPTIPVTARATATRGVWRQETAARITKRPAKSRVSEREIQ